MNPPTPTELTYKTFRRTAVNILMWCPAVALIQFVALKLQWPVMLWFAGFVSGLYFVWITGSISLWLEFKKLTESE
jgi:hypothetical protein